MNRITVSRQTVLTSLAIFGAAVGIFIACVLKLFNVFNGKVIWDTSYYLNIGANFIDHMALTPYMWRLDPNWNIISGSGSGYGVLLLCLWLKLFGLTVISGQALMYLVGLINLPLFYVLAKQWWDGRRAWWALVFFVFSSPFALDYYVRMDALALLTATAILLLHLIAVKSRRNLLHFAVGVALVLGLEVHILIALYIGALGFYYFIAQIAEMRKRKTYRLWLVTPTLYFGVGLVLSLGVYFVVHILPNPSIYFLIPSSCPLCIQRSIANEFQRWISYFLTQPFLLVPFLCGLVVACVRRTEADWHVLVLFIGGVISLFILNPPTQSTYTMMLLPIFALLAAVFIAEPAALGTVHIRIKYSRAYLWAVGFCVLCFVTMLDLSYSQTTFTYPRQRDYVGTWYSSTIAPQNYSVAIDYIRAYIPHDAVIMGQVDFYSDLLDFHNFLSYRDGDQYGMTIRHENMLSFWQRQKPVIFIGEISSDPDLVTYMNLLNGFIEVTPDLWIQRSYLVSMVPGGFQPGAPSSLRYF